jgi:hypothetical protein
MQSHLLRAGTQSAESPFRNCSQFLVLQQRFLQPIFPCSLHLKLATSLFSLSIFEKAFFGVYHCGVEQFVGVMISCDRQAQLFIQSLGSSSSKSASRFVSSAPNSLAPGHTNLCMCYMDGIAVLDPEVVLLARNTAIMTIMKCHAGTYVRTS